MFRRKSTPLKTDPVGPFLFRMTKIFFSFFRPNSYISVFVSTSTLQICKRGWAIPVLEGGRGARARARRNRADRFRPRAPFRAPFSVDLSCRAKSYTSVSASMSTIGTYRCRLGWTQIEGARVRKRPRSAAAARGRALFRVPFSTALSV